MSTNRSATGGVGGEIDRHETCNLIASDKVEGTDVRRTNGDKIGSIDRLMIDKRSGRVAYAVMSFGGFLGLGESRRPIPWEALRYNENLDAYELDLDEDQLRAAPPYTDSGSFDWSDAEWNRSMRAHYAAPGADRAM